MSSKIEWRAAEGHPYRTDDEIWVGPDAVVQKLFLRLGEEWDGFTVAPHSFYDAGETVVVEARYTGKYNATGRELDSPTCHVWKLKDGKITSFQQYIDTAQFDRIMARS